MFVAAGYGKGGATFVEAARKLFAAADTSFCYGNRLKMPLPLGVHNAAPAVAHADNTTSVSCIVVCIWVIEGLSNQARG